MFFELGMLLKEVVLQVFDLSPWVALVLALGAAGFAIILISSKKSSPQ